MFPKVIVIGSPDFRIYWQLAKLKRELRQAEKKRIVEEPAGQFELAFSPPSEKPLFTGNWLPCDRCGKPLTPLEKQNGLCPFCDDQP